MKGVRGQLRFLAPFVLFLTSFIYLLHGLNPAFYADDSPETITAAVTLGVPHPPGYPFLTLLGRLFSLLPLSGFPLRVNLLSPVLASLVCALLYLFLVKGLRVTAWIAAPVSLFWAVGTSLYPAALSAKGEVYELNSLLILGLFWGLQSGQRRITMFLAGVFLTHHWMTLLVFMPGLFLFVRLENNKFSWSAREWLNAALWLNLGLSLWLVLPLLSAREPMLNWGDPRDLKNFIFVLLRREYLGAEANASIADWIAQAQYGILGQWREFAGLSLAALFFALTLLKKKEPLAWGFFTGWGFLLVSICLYLHLSPDRFYLINSYTLVTHLPVLVFLGWGTQKAWEKSKPELQSKLLKGILMILISWLAGLGTLRDLKDRQTSYTCVYDYALNSFKCLPAHSLFFCRGDSMVFPSWYFQWVERVRPDLVIVGVDGLPMDWIRRNLSLQHPTLLVPYSKQKMGNESIAPLMSWLILKNSRIPQFLSYNQLDAQTQPVQNLLPYGLVYQCFLDRATPPLDEARANFLWTHLRLRHLHDPNLPLEPRTRQWILVDYGVDRNGLGIYFENRADDEAEKLSNNRRGGNRENVIQDYFKSLEQFSWCQAWDPTDPVYCFNMGNALVHLGQNSEALKYYDKAVELDSKYKDAYFNAAVAALNLGQGQKAGEMFRKVLGLDPSHAEAKRGLAYVTQLGWYHSNPP